MSYKIFLTMIIATRSCNSWSGPLEPASGSRGHILAGNKKPAAMNGGFASWAKRTRLNGARDLLLPRALFVTVRLEAFPALVLRHFQPAFLFEITHGVEIESAPCEAWRDL